MKTLKCRCRPVVIILYTIENLYIVGTGTKLLPIHDITYGILYGLRGMYLHLYTITR